MKMNRLEVVEYINTLEGYEGYIQYSDRKIEDIWTNKSNIVCDPKDGFVLEAHFFNGTDSIVIRQINDIWLVDESKNISLDYTKTFYIKNGLKANMAQIWEIENDPLCEDLEVKKLKKVVFAGFEGDIK